MAAMFYCNGKVCYIRSMVFVGVWETTAANVCISDGLDLEQIELCCQEVHDAIEFIQHVNDVPRIDCKKDNKKYNVRTESCFSIRI